MKMVHRPADRRCHFEKIPALHWPVARRRAGGIRSAGSAGVAQDSAMRPVASAAGPAPAWAK
jgi:hypothetical protein